jgi:hypothetical protein
MNNPWRTLPGRQGLYFFCLAAVISVALTGCPSTSSSSSSTSASPAAAGTDTLSSVLGTASGTGGGGGSSEVSVPVQASGSGNLTTESFMVSDSTLNVTYSYDCSQTGGSGFTADLISGTSVSQGSDDENIASESGTSDQETVSVSPQDAPGSYFLQVQSPCDWQIVVANG